jgi:hypothetical protein
VQLLLGIQIRRRTQMGNFLELEVFLPDDSVQKSVVNYLQEKEDQIGSQNWWAG